MSVFQPSHNPHAYQVIELSDDEDVEEFPVASHEGGQPHFRASRDIGQPKFRVSPSPEIKQSQFRVPILLPDDEDEEEDINGDAINLDRHVDRKGKSVPRANNLRQQNNAVHSEVGLNVFINAHHLPKSPPHNEVKKEVKGLLADQLEVARSVGSSEQLMDEAAQFLQILPEHNLHDVNDDDDDDDYDDDDEFIWLRPHLKAVKKEPLVDIQQNTNNQLQQSIMAENQDPQGAFMVEDDEPLNIMQDIAQNSRDIKAAAITTVIDLFPDICPDFLNTLWDDLVHGGDAQVFVASVLERMDKDKQYPKKKKKSLKRKREADEEEELSNKFEYFGRLSLGYTYSQTARNILQEEFPRTPANHVDKVLSTNRGLLFPAYRLLEEHERILDEVNHSPYRKLKKARKPSHQYLPDHIANTIATSGVPHAIAAMEELVAARKVRAKADARRQCERQKQLDEEENTRRAEREGTMQECGCCFCDYPLNRMVHCNNETEFHWFCRGCARQTAENEIGNGKYIVACMSMDGCEAGFSQDQRTIFLESQSILALERNEQEAMLRMAGIENLASCPFCPYAAEYPPVEEFREFRCEAPDCKKVSCRLCKLESHIPKTCAESAKENGISARRLIEEAMSAALIRKCNKCGTPFIKEEGCNKMMCTSAGCRNIQCYICSKSCGYDHFNDTTRGGRDGNCPLFGDVATLHETEVKKAEREALDKVRAEHPELAEEDLKVIVSERVLKDEAARKQGSRNRYGFPVPGPVVPPAGRYRDIVHHDYNYYRRQAMMDPLDIDDLFMVENIPPPPRPQAVEPAQPAGNRPGIHNFLGQLAPLIRGRRRNRPVERAAAVWIARERQANAQQPHPVPPHLHRLPLPNQIPNLGRPPVVNDHERRQELAGFRQYLNQLPVAPAQNLPLDDPNEWHPWDPQEDGEAAVVPEFHVDRPPVPAHREYGFDHWPFLVPNGAGEVAAEAGAGVGVGPGMGVVAGAGAGAEAGAGVNRMPQRNVEDLQRQLDHVQRILEISRNHRLLLEGMRRHHNPNPRSPDLEMRYAAHNNNINQRLRRIEEEDMEHERTVARLRGEILDIERAAADDAIIRDAFPGVAFPWGVIDDPDNAGDAFMEEAFPEDIIGDEDADYDDGIDDDDVEFLFENYVPDPPRNQNIGHLPANDRWAIRRAGLEAVAAQDAHVRDHQAVEDVALEADDDLLPYEILREMDNLEMQIMRDGI